MKVGTWLLKEKKTIKINDLALMLGVSRRTLLNWRNQAQTTESKIGRPAYDQKQKVIALLAVGREWKKQGSNVGWRPIESKLQNKIPTRLLQQTLSRLKLLHRKKRREQLASKKQSVRVRFKNIVWVQDGAKFDGSIHQIIKDRGSFKILSVRRNKEDTGEAVISQLEAEKKIRGLPLVLGTDNGSNYTSQKVQEFLFRNKIIHLRSLPRTPQHNGAVECAIREIKEVAILDDISLAEAATKLNKNRLRARFAFKSSEEVDDKTKSVHDENIRNAFFEKCQVKIKEMQATAENKRSMRMAERSVVFETLEQFGFIDFKRGRPV